MKNKNLNDMRSKNTSHITFDDFFNDTPKKVVTIRRKRPCKEV